MILIWWLRFLIFDVQWIGFSMEIEATWKFHHVISISQSKWFPPHPSPVTDLSFQYSIFLDYMRSNLRSWNQKSRYFWKVILLVSQWYDWCDSLNKGTPSLTCYMHDMHRLTGYHISNKRVYVKLSSVLNDHVDKSLVDFQIFRHAVELGTKLLNSKTRELYHLAIFVEVGACKHCF
jgi:hypothetical protein